MDPHALSNECVFRLCPQTLLILMCQEALAHSVAAMVKRKASSAVDLWVTIREGNGLSEVGLSAALDTLTCLPLLCWNVIHNTLTVLMKPRVHGTPYFYGTNNDGAEDKNNHEEA